MINLDIEKAQSIDANYTIKNNTTNFLESYFNTELDIDSELNDKYANISSDFYRSLKESNTESDVITAVGKFSDIVDRILKKYIISINDHIFNQFTAALSNKINEGVLDITNARFDINPKKIDKDNLGCMYCPFKDICFMKVEDIKELPKKDILDYLGGDPNA